MKTGIIGYGSMGRMLLWKFSESGISKQDLYASNRTIEKLEEALGYNRLTEAVLVGAGRLGRALLEYDEFQIV